MQKRFRSGGLAAWSIRRPVGVTMLALALAVMGLFALGRLGVDLLPHLIYPEIGVRVMDPGVPARIMEDQISRQLEEQLAITEGAVRVQSNTSEGRSSVDLSFPYGSDINIALRDAAARLDRAKRFLPDSIDPPVIFKRDPSQIPVLELVIGSASRSPTELREWVDYRFAKLFLTLPGVAAVEVGGAPKREVHLLVDQERLAGAGLHFSDLTTALDEENLDTPGGRLATPRREFGARTTGRFQSIGEIESLPLSRGEAPLRLGELVEVRDTHEDERLRVRLNGESGVKVSVQKQPEANTVEVVDAVKARLDWLKDQSLLPADITVGPVGDQSVYVRNALRNAAYAGLSGALLAMVVVYLFLGNLRRTLIIGTAIPFAVLVTFAIMDLAGLTLNIMTLGGLALGIGMLVDSTIVMLENITRHQGRGAGLDAPIQAASEVNSAIVASTSTNLAAVLPFLFIGGLAGLLFHELIITIAAAIIASLVVALTLVPSYGARVHDVEHGRLRRLVDRVLMALGGIYARLTGVIVRRPWLPVLLFVPALALAVFVMVGGKQVFLPSMDEGRISASVVGDAGVPFEQTDAVARQLEALFLEQPEVESVFTLSGGFVFGRSSREAGNRATLNIQLKSPRDISSDKWVKKMQGEIRKLGLAGFKVRMRVRGVRGIRLGAGDDDISVRVQGEDIETLARIGDAMVARVQGVPGIRNVTHSYEENRDEVVVRMDRERAAALGVRASEIGHAVRVALDGLIVSDYISGDRQYDVRLRLAEGGVTSPEALANVVVAVREGRAVRLRDVAQVTLAPAPATILRDNQQRIVELTASLTPDAALNEVMAAIHARLADLSLSEGYQLYDGGAAEALQQGRAMGGILLGLAVFLVFVVMAVQYESLRNPLVILLSVPFAVTGVAAGTWLLDLPLSMPVWLGLIMLTGIVVNNAIVLVEQIEIQRERGSDIDEAIVEAARLRLRPILMTTLTTVFGMLPLALGVGEGAEMLQPLAVVMVWGLSFSMLVSLTLVPAIYRLFHRAIPAPRPALSKAA